MAPRPNPADNAERNERELNADVNAAIAGTEQEIFDEALGDESLELDGDTSLEEMGDGLEGEQVEDENAEEVDAEIPAQQVQAKAPKEGDEAEADAEGDEEEQPRDERGRFDERADGRTVALREERERRRAAEAERNTLAEQIKALNQRLDTTLTQIASTRPAAPQAEQRPAEPKPEPDMFADPDGWKAWNKEQAKETARREAETLLQQYEQRQQQVTMQRVDENMRAAAQGPRGFEFDAAYKKLSSLNPQDPGSRATVNRILQSPDPAAQLFEWWEDNGAEEFRDQVAEQLGFTQRQQQRPSRQQQPQHEVRLPASLRSNNPPSLNSARGAQRQQITDPEMMDESEESIFRYGTR